MGKQRKQHYFKLFSWAREYAKANGFKYFEYSEYHMRIIQDELCVLDMWSTGKYYVKETNYNLYEAHITERAGETGFLHVADRAKYTQQLNKLFYPVDFA